MICPIIWTTIKNVLEKRLVSGVGKNRKRRKEDGIWKKHFWRIIWTRAK